MCVSGDALAGTGKACSVAEVVLRVMLGGGVFRAESCRTSDSAQIAQAQQNLCFSCLFQLAAGLVFRFAECAG